MQKLKLLWLLSSYIINFPILYEWGLTMPMPIALVFESWINNGLFIQKLCSDPCIIDQGTGIIKMKKIVTEKNRINSQGIFLRQRYAKTLTAKEQDKLDLLLSIASDKSIEQMPVIAAPFLIYERVVPAELRGKVFEIRLPFDEKPYNDFMPEIYAFIPSPEQLGQIKRKIIDENDETGLLAAAEFLYPRLYECEKGEEQERICDLAKELTLKQQDVDAEEEILSVFSDCIMKYAAEGGFEEAYKLPYLDGGAVKDMETACFVKDQWLYISEKKFNEICNSIIAVVSITNLKYTLRNLGVIKGSKDGYTTKMNYCTVYGYETRKHMITIDMEVFSDAEGYSLKYYLEYGA